MNGSHISLFAGVGMTDIAAESAGFKTIATAEIDSFCRSVLRERFPHAWHYDDVREVSIMADELRHAVRLPLLISGGFPCQDVSNTGTKQGLDGARSGLWSEFKRVIEEFQPDYVLIENSPSLKDRGLDRILNDVHHLSYDAQWDCIPAAFVGAPHLRDRIYIGAIKRTGASKRHALETKIIGHVGVPGNGCSSAGKPLTKLPRAGASIGGLLFRREPKATIKAAKARAAHPSYPTPTKSDGTGGPGVTPKRTGGKNLRTVVAELEGNGRINPAFGEWLMGLPRGWTDPRRANDILPPFHGWETRHMPLTVSIRIPNRSERIQALGNGLVPQCAAIALNDLLNW